MLKHLIQIAVEFDNGSRYVSIDQYDDAMEQIDFLAAEGNVEAQDYLDSL